MKILAIDGSPRSTSGNTYRILKPFLDGAAEAGADTQEVHLARRTIHPCVGDFACWLRTPGQCIRDDDMTELRPRVAAADVLVLATPVYVDGPTAQMKTFVDRLVPLVEPFIELRKGHCRHPGRGGARDQKLVLVSSCGFWELDNFDPLVTWAQAMCRNLGAEFAGALLRPHAGMLEALEQMGHPPAKVYDAAREAGRQLVRDGAIDEKTLKLVARKLIPRRLYLLAANRHFRKEIKRGKDA
jgi:multimeric flavodoxin WrbA